MQNLAVVRLGIFLLLGVFAVPARLGAQGVTASSIGGIVTDASGKPVAGAEVTAVDTSSGHPVLVASDPVTATNAANRDYAQPVSAALDGPFTEGSVGFAGTASDGLTQLD